MLEFCCVSDTNPKAAGDQATNGKGQSVNLVTSELVRMATRNSTRSGSDAAPMVKRYFLCEAGKRLRGKRKGSSVSPLPYQSVSHLHYVCVVLKALATVAVILAGGILAETAGGPPQRARASAPPAPAVRGTNPIDALGLYQPESIRSILLLYL